MSNVEYLTGIMNEIREALDGPLPIRTIALHVSKASKKSW